MDSANWAQLFCTPALNSSAQCGPQLPPPTPPPVPVHPRQGGRCLIGNSSTYPCAGGWAESCPIALGDCSDATATWAWAPAAGAGATLTNLAPAYLGNSVINIDCNNCAPGTLAKVTTRLGYADALVYDAQAGVMRVPQCPGMCLSGAPGAPPQTPPCKGGEYTAPQQVVLASCTDAAAGGWSV